MKLIYIAAPYTTHDEFEKQLNIEAAKYIGYKIAKAGMMPVLPTVNTALFDEANSPEFWYEGTLELMRRCDAVYVLDGSDESKGVINEIAIARSMQLPVFTTIKALTSCLT